MSGAASKAAVPRTIFVLGHSIANGVGADDTVNGGAALPSGVSLRDSGSNLSAWPDSSGLGPDPGILPRLAALAQAAGATTLQIVRRSTNGQIIAGVQTTELVGAIRDQAALGCPDPDLVVLMIGENDAQSGESAAYATRLPVVIDLILQRWPGTRIVLQDAVTSDLVGYPEVASIQAANVTATARAQTELSSRAGITTQDTVHYSLAGYTRAAENIWNAWLAVE